MPRNRSTSLTNEMLSIFKRYPASSFLVLIGILLSSIGQALTVTGLYPVLELLAGRSLRLDGTIWTTVTTAFEFLGIETSVGSLLLFAMVLALIYAALSISSEIYQGMFIRRIENSLRSELIRATLEAKWEYIRRLGHGAFINLVTREAEAYKGLIKFGFLILNGMLHSAFLIGLAIWIDWRLSGLGLAVILFGTCAFIPLFRSANRLGHEWVGAYGQLTGRLVWAARSLKATKAGSLETQVAEALRGPVTKVGDVYFMQRVLEASQVKLGELISIASVCMVIYIGLRLLQMQGPEIIMILVVFSRALPQLRGVFVDYQRACGMMASAVLVRKGLEEAYEEAQERGVSCVPEKWEQIRFEDVDFSYGRQKPGLIKGLTLTISRGDCWGIVGPTGSGKTTFLDLLLALNRPEKGRILIGSTSLHGIDLRTWHGRIGYVGQEPLVFAGTVRSNLMWSVSGSIDDGMLLRALRQAHLTELVTNHPRGLEREITEDGNNLSGGEKQRLALARCFLRKSEILILDEPTSALDQESERRILDALEELRGSITVIIVTHRPEVWSFCTGIIRFRDASVDVEYPTIATLAGKGVVRNG